MIIYTDGATSGNGKENAVGGWGWYCEDTSDMDFGSVVKNATNQVCELLAAIEACQYASQRIKNQISFPMETIKIMSDSAYLVNCWKEQWYKTWRNNGWKNSKKEPVANQDLWEELINYFEDPNYEFIKVRGHAGIIGNEKADHLACKGRDYAREIYRAEKAGE